MRASEPETMPRSPAPKDRHPKLRRADGRRALVIGGSGEIGSAIARMLAAEGADVAIHYHERRTEAEKVAGDVRRLGRRTAVVQAALESSKSVYLMRDQLHESFGTIDTLVNCAGINRDCLFAKMNDDLWAEVIQVNLFGTYHCSRAFVEEIVASGRGRIINISSVAGHMGNEGQVNCAASKRGVIGFTMSLARELARVGTTVNVVAPGFIATSVLDTITDDVKQKALSQIPMNRFGTPREVALGVIHLVSDASDYVTGSVLNLNGGMYL